MRQNTFRWYPALLCVMVGCLALATPARVGAAPTVTLTPVQGPCVGTLVLTLRGSGLPAGIVPGYSIGIRGEGPITWGNLPAVATDGTLTTQLELRFCDKIPVPPGAVIVVTVWDGPYRDSKSVVLASANYTVTNAPSPGLPNTGGGGMAARDFAPLSGALLAAVALIGAAWRRGNHVRAGSATVRMHLPSR